VIDADLQDLLALWLGDHDPGEERRATLLSRLHIDAPFRRAFVEEIRLHGMLRAVQSAEPRWLRLEDATGWSAHRPHDVETLVARVAAAGQRLRPRRRRLPALAAVAAAVLILVALVLALRPHTAPEPPAPPEPPVDVAAVIKLDNVRWEADSAALAEGKVIATGRLRLKSGRLTLAFFSGVTLTVEGPADLEVRSGSRVYCHRGKLRARVPRGAEGFTVLAPGYEVVDLGTEFGLNLDADGKSQLLVFEGAAAVSMLGDDGKSVTSALLEGKRSVEVEPKTRLIRDIEAQPEAFVPLAEFVPPALDLAPEYAEVIRAAKPWGYWRFAALDDEQVPNEVAGRPALKALGGVTVERPPTGSPWARFHPDRHKQAFLMDGTWTPPRATGYAIELWVQADLPSPTAYSQTALVSLLAADDAEPENHLAYLELTARGWRSPHEPCAVRFVDRWPPGQAFGSNVFSRRSVVPSLWRHIVGQKTGDTVELYVDGEKVGTTPARWKSAGPQDAGTVACRLLVGRLKQRSGPPFLDEVRPLEGRLGELAVYDRPLTAEEIRRHARMLAGAGGG
jgi:hypothetical protein